MKIVFNSIISLLLHIDGKDICQWHQKCCNSRAKFHLTFATLLESFYPCYSANVKQGRMIFMSVASIKWNLA